MSYSGEKQISGKGINGKHSGQKEQRQERKNQSVWRAAHVSE
jgi:hypothetical protein